MKCLTGGHDTPTLELGSKTLAQCDTEPQISMFVSLSCLVTNILGFEMTRATQGHGGKEQEME